MKKKNTEISIVLPVFNEENNLVQLFNELFDVLKKIDFKTFEIIFINDGSTDDSLKIIKDLSVKNKSVKYIDLSRNFGQQIAISAGVEKASGNYIVIMDSDLQDPTDLIQDLYNKAQEGYDVVYAKRKKRKGESVFKKITAKIFYRTLRSITKCNIPVDAGDFRIISSKVSDVLKRMPEQQKFLRGQVAWVGFKQTSVEFDRDSRKSGKSGYSVSKMLRFAIDGITSFSDFPLKLATFLGFFVSIISFILMLWALYQRLIAQQYVQGWTSLILSVLFIGGIQLITIGIIGEYIGRIGSNIRKRPLYVINETNLEEEEEKS
ncbi:MAG TPA: glycosyltransferase family 2 protein [Bacteroidales bacterium]|nr:glycosyltransferase family 2 protein [Bacteroidales bacterium]